MVDQSTPICSSTPTRGTHHIEVKAPLSGRMVATLIADGHCHKIFQIAFAKDVNAAPEAEGLALKELHFRNSYPAAVSLYSGIELWDHEGVSFESSVFPLE